MVFRHIQIEMFLLVSDFFDVTHTGTRVLLTDKKISLIKGCYFFPSPIKL